MNKKENKANYCFPITYCQKKLKIVQQILKLSNFLSTYPIKITSCNNFHTFEVYSRVKFCQFLSDYNDFGIFVKTIGSVVFFNHSKRKYACFVGLF